MLERTENLMAALEAILVAVVGRVACWLAPLPSAVLVARSTSRIFELGGVLAIVMAGTVELIGLVTSNLWLTAKEWNRTKRKSDPAANERLALILIAGYFITTFALLLGFEIPNVIETGSAVGLVSLLFPCLSAVAVIALNERVIHYHRIREVATDKEQRRKRTGTRSGTKPAKKAGPRAEPYATISGKTRRRAAAILAERPAISGSELGRQLDRSERLGRQLKAELMAELFSGGNGSDAGE